MEGVGGHWLVTLGIMSFSRREWLRTDSLMSIHFPLEPPDYIHHILSHEYGPETLLNTFCFMKNDFIWLGDSAMMVGDVFHIPG